MTYVDIAEWTELGARLAACRRDKFEEIVEALRRIVDAYTPSGGYDEMPIFVGRASTRDRE